VTRALLLAAALVLTSVSPGFAQARDYGTFGTTCAPRSRMPSAVATTTTTLPWPRPAATRMTLVVDVACPAALDAIRALARFQRQASRVEIEVLVVDPSAWTRISRASGEAIITSLDRLALRWDPARLRAMRLAAVPYFRVEDPDGRIVSARGVPSLEALVGALR
jgi:hypothetical protein